MIQLEKKDLMKDIKDNLNIVRRLENIKYFGYLVYISYDGKYFDSFDDNDKLKSVKGVFKKILNILGINVVKGIQQAGRTDKYVSAENNILYFNSKNILNCDKILSEINEIIENDIQLRGIKINKILRSIPIVDFPSEIKSRKYIYSYPKNLIKNNVEEINNKINELNGTHNFSDFTTKKGKKILELERTVNIEYKNFNLIVKGNKFLPQQVRIMSNYILNNKKTPSNAEYLTFVEAELSENMKKQLLYPVEKTIFLNNNIVDINDADIEFIERNEYIYIFYVQSKNKGKIIGKNGKNIKKIKKIKKILGDIVIKELK